MEKFAVVAIYLAWNKYRHSHFVDLFTVAIEYPTEHQSGPASSKNFRRGPWAKWKCCTSTSSDPINTHDNHTPTPSQIDSGKTA